MVIGMWVGMSKGMSMGASMAMSATMYMDGSVVTSSKRSTAMLDEMFVAMFEEMSRVP